MNRCPPVDLVMNETTPAKAARRWAKLVRTGIPSCFGREMCFDDAFESLVVDFPHGTPDSFADRSGAAMSAARCLDIVAAIRRTPDEVTARLEEDMLSVAAHALTLVDRPLPAEADHVVAMTATPWSPGLVLAAGPHRLVVDVTPAEWRDAAPRAVRASRLGPGRTGWRLGPASARMDMSEIDAMHLLRCAPRGAAACSAGHRWTSPTDEDWRKPSRRRKVPR